MSAGIGEADSPISVRVGCVVCNSVVIAEMGENNPISSRGRQGVVRGVVVDHGVIAGRSEMDPIVVVRQVVICDSVVVAGIGEVDSIAV